MNCLLLSPAPRAVPKTPVQCFTKAAAGASRLTLDRFSTIFVQCLQSTSQSLQNLCTHNLAGKLVLCRFVTKSAVGTFSSIAKQRSANPFHNFCNLCSVSDKPKLQSGFSQKLSQPRHQRPVYPHHCCNLCLCTDIQLKAKEEKKKTEREEIFKISSALSLSFHCKPPSI